MWAHPHQAHLHSLEEADHKLLLLADDGPNWLYTFVQMNNTMSHVPLSSEGHISAMTDGMPSTKACGQLHQLQVWKLLQHRGWVVCQEGLNGKFKALQFTFQKLPLWNAATTDKPGWDPPLIELDLSSVQPNSMTTTIQAPTTTLVLAPLWLLLLNLLTTSLWPSTNSSRGPWSSCSRLPLLSHYLSPGTVCQRESCPQQPWGFTTKWNNRGSPRPNQEDPAIPAPMAIPTQASPWAVMPEDVPIITHISHSPSPPTVLKLPGVASTFPIPQLQATPRVDPARLPDEVLWLQGQINMALVWLLLTRATMDSCCRELELNTELTMCMNVNEAQAIETIKETEMSHAAKIKEAEVYHTTRIKEAEVCHTTNSCVLQQSNQESMLALECEAIAEEGWDCQAFVEATAVALWACPPETHLALIDPLQLLTTICF